MSNPFEPSREPGSGDRHLHPLERPAPTYQRPSAPPPSSPQGGQPRRVSIGRSEPMLSYAFLGINVLVFVADVMLNGRLTELGQKDNALIMSGELWRFVTPMFLHYGIIHLGVNSYSLFIMGPQVERMYGPWRFAAIYLLSGMAGVIASFTFIPYLSAGASGAIFGLFGALLPLLYRNRTVIQDTRGRIMSLVQVLVINLLISLAPGIDLSAHVGGLIGGLALGWFATPLLKVTQDFDGSIKVQDTASQALVWAAIGVIAVGLVGLAYWVMLLKGGMVGG